ncbi:MAG: hypothetical protein V7K25_24555 [Nostoc sp.]|uniref:hypothetical protein n=1 Tax=Nostoc sp. TaxID=1180 RepID=UPI002FF4780E
MGNYIPARDDQGRQLPPTSDIPTGQTLTPSNPIITAATPPEDKLPDNFKPFDHLQKVYIPQHNALVKKYFSDHPEDWKPNVATARSSLRVACTMLDDDNEAIMNLRHHLLFDLLGYGKKDLGVFYGIPAEQFQESVVGRPQVFLYFTQDSASIPEGEIKVKAEYSFRLMNETPATMTPSKALAIAKEVKSQFVLNGQGIVFTKGKNIYKYYHEEHGYRLQIYGNTETDTQDIITRLLKCQNIPYDENRLVVSIPKKASITNPTETELVYGAKKKKPRYRPIVNVRFRYAYLYLRGKDRPIYLVDTTGRHYQALA